MRVLSGIQPTGRPHWGNYFGAIRQYIDLQHGNEAYYFIANLHALTTVRDAAIQAALMKAAEIPLETARACAEVAALAVTCAHHGNSNAVSDAGVAALLAEAACRGAAYNVRINVSAMADKAAGQPLSSAAAALVVETHTLAQQATAAVEAAIGD